MNDLINKLVRVAKMKLPELDDRTAAGYGELYPEWSSKRGKLVSVDTRLWYNGCLWKVTTAILFRMTGHLTRRIHCL